MKEEEGKSGNIGGRGRHIRGSMARFSGSQARSLEIDGREESLEVCQSSEIAGGALS